MSHIPSAIDRYLNGMMSVQEQTEFATQLAANPTLRATLEAEQLIRSTVRNDVAAFPAEHALTRSRVMESLATVKAPAGVVVSGAAWYASGALLKGLLGIITVAGLSVGGYLWMQQSNNRSEPPSPPMPVSAAPQPLATPESSSVINSATTAAEPEKVEALPKPLNTTTNDERVHTSVNRIKRGNPQPSSPDAVASSDAANPQPQVATATTEETASQTARPPAGARQLRVVNKDSVKLKVQVKVK